MVYSADCGVERKRARGSGTGRTSFMAMGPERSKPLHNFSLPRLKWGCQKHLRCVKVGETDSGTSSGERRSPSPALRYDFSALRLESDDERCKVEKRQNGVLVSKFRTQGGEFIDCDKEIGAVREKFMIDLKAAMDKMRDEFLGEGLESGVPAVPAKEENSEADAAAAVASEVRPWNLRKRRAACKAPIGVTDGAKINHSPSRTDAVDGLKPMLRSSGGGVPEKKELPRFSATLKRSEIEEDFIKMTGQKPPRRPKKRPRIVQKQVEALYPGYWLTEVTADRYKVPEISDNAKR